LALILEKSTADDRATQIGEHETNLLERLHLRRIILLRTLGLCCGGLLLLISLLLNCGKGQ